MTAGSMTFVLHTHLPYCRESGRWPHGEEWFHEAMLECYLPLLRAFRRLAGEIHGSLGVTINITPILAEQMADPLMAAHFRAYLDDRIQRAREDVTRMAARGPLMGQTAAFHLARYEAVRDFYTNEIKTDPLKALRILETSGHIEVATSAATHGYLPLLENENAVRFQVHSGVRSHVANFGRRPRSFWLPECAYRPGLEQVLAAEGLRVFFVETHLVTGGRARGKALGGMLGPYPETKRPVAAPVRIESTYGTTFRAYTVGRSPVEVIARNERTGKQVWSASHGYPGDPAYREFHKKDGESGLHYWRVTGPEVDLGDKLEYDHTAAAEAARGHARHFHDLVRSELDSYLASAGEPGVVVSAYDTELFGHWWLEGVDWLETTIRRLAADPDVLLTTAGDYVSAVPPKETIDLPEGSWGNGGDHRTWLNPDTAWTWPEVRARQTRAERLLREDMPATRQLARELLLLQSSDWQFLMTTGQAHDYAIDRFRSHCDRFDAIADGMESRDPGLDELVAGLEALDNPFPGIDPTSYLANAVSASR